MGAVTEVPPPVPVVMPRAAVPPFIADGLAVTWRNLLALARRPEAVVFATIQPIVFTVMFRYVMSGAIQVPNGSYVDYLIPGIFAQTMTLGLVNTVHGLSEDLRSGMIERFRSLPMAPSAVLVGRTLADLVRNTAVVVLVAIVGFAIGFRVHTGPAGLLAAMALVLLLSVALSWVVALVGLTIRNAATAQAAVFPPLFVLVFGSSVFAPVATMPAWLQAFASHQPVSVTVDAARALVLGGPTGEYVLRSVGMSLAILAAFVPLAIRAYRRTS